MKECRVIIVTGAAAGIGSAIVDTLLASPTSRLLLVDINEEPLKTRHASSGSDRVQYVVGDVSEPETNNRAVEAAIGKWGRLDALALNAGVLAPVHRLEGSNAADWTRIFGINVVSQVAMLSVAIPYLRQSKGRVIVTSSNAGLKPSFAAWGAYGATKAALNYLVKVLTLEEPDIIAVGLFPGVVDTPLVHHILGGKYSAGMTEDELVAYKDWALPRLVKPTQPGSVIGKLALKADEKLRGKILYWDDEKFAEYR
ncbi:hypothetical protein LTR85_009305 [Meristemomyces frigidus]|nr:hypothetical protein LTR85_009305 [Meristemomyces frigidus]